MCVTVSFFDERQSEIIACCWESGWASPGAASSRAVQVPSGRGNGAIPLGNVRRASSAAHVTALALADATVRTRVPAGSAGVGVLLAGDASHEFEVDQADLAIIQAHLVAVAGQAGYLASADSDLNGRINGRDDVRLTRRSLGAATTVRRLQALTAQSTGKANLGAWKNQALVTGSASAGSAVPLISTARGTPSRRAPSCSRPRRSSRS